MAREVSEVGRDTPWASIYAACEALDDEIKSYLETLSAIHDIGYFRNTFSAGENDGKKLLQGMNKFSCAIHPVIKTHPVSGRKFLYVNESFTQHILGLTARESRIWLNWLLDHVSRPGYQVRFRWQKGAVAMWDNRCTQHYAVATICQLIAALTR